MLVRSTTGFHRPGRHCSHQARSAVSCLTSRMKGELQHTTEITACEANLQMYDSLKKLPGNLFPGKARAGWGGVNSIWQRKGCAMTRKTATRRKKKRQGKTKQANQKQTQATAKTEPKTGSSQPSQCCQNNAVSFLLAGHKKNKVSP